VVIRRKRIRNVKKHLSEFTGGQMVIISCPLAEVESDRVADIGFKLPVSPGDRILPAGLGPVSRFNAEGGYHRHKERGLETVYHQRVWPPADPRRRVTQTRMVDVPYTRYPRSPIPPPSCEVEVREAPDGGLVLVADAIPHTDSKLDRLRHVINLFLELFGECDPLDKDLAPVLKVPVRRVNWDILPPGQCPWDVAREHIVERAPAGNRPIVKRRLETIHGFRPDEVVAGRGGFASYVVFLFRDRGLAVVESAQYPNATYVFGEDWETLSQMTKAEILAGALEEQRIIHRQGWERRIHDLLS
jgi:hypothetical protein